MDDALVLARDDNVELSSSCSQAAVPKPVDNVELPTFSTANTTTTSTTNTTTTTSYTKSLENQERSMSRCSSTKRTRAVGSMELSLTTTDAAQQLHEADTVNSKELSLMLESENQQQEPCVVDSMELSSAKQQDIDLVEPQAKRPRCQQQTDASTSVTPPIQADDTPFEDTGIDLPVLLHRGTDATMNIPTPQEDRPEPASAKYEKGSVVLYEGATYRGLATVVAVHYDDELDPYYTISYGNTAEKQTTDEHLSPAPCQGLTLQYLLSKKRSDKAQVDTGFSRIVADAGHRFSTAVGNGLEWPVDSRLFCGCIDDPETNDVRMYVSFFFVALSLKFCSFIFLTLIIALSRPRLLRCRDSGPSPQDESAAAGPHWQFGFVSSLCTGSSNDGSPCKHCLGEEQYFVRKCYNNATRNDRDPMNVNGVNLSSEQSPTKLRNGNAVRQENLRLCRQRERVLQRKIDKLKKQIANAEEREMSESLLKALEIEHPAELYTDQVKELWKKELAGESIERIRLAETLFEENKLHAERARECGKKTCRFSNAMYSFVIQLRIKLGGGRYDFLAKVCGLPSDRQVRRQMSQFSSAAKVCNGGILHDNIQEAGEMLYDRYGEIPLDDPRRTFEVAWDSTAIVEGLEISTRSNEVVGVAYDGEGGGNFFKTVLDSLGDIFEDDDEEESSDSAPSSSSDSKVDRAEHFLLFLASSTDRNTPLIRISVARYGLKSVDSDFLKRHVDAITHAMFVEGLVARGKAFDGASENRAWAKSRVTHTINDLIELDLLPAEWKDDQFIPGDLKIAYLHPAFDAFDPGGNVFIFLHPDMSHATKKVVNAFEFSGKDESARELIFRAQSITLNMIMVKWEEHTNTPGQIRTTRLGLDHFIKNCNSRMRSYLAFQITSRSTVAMLDDVLQGEDEIAEYAPLRELLLLFNDMIDIMNDKADKAKKGIASKSHPDLERLKLVLTTIEEWRQEVDEDEELDLDNFLPMSTYEDLSWLVAGTTGLVYSLCEQGDVPFTFAPGRCGTDPIENRFGDIKGHHSGRVGVKGANSGNHMADVHSGQGFTMKHCGNARGSAIPSAPLRDRERKRKR